MHRHTAGAVRQGVSQETLWARSLITLRYGDHRDVISPVQGLLLCLNTVLAVEDAAHGLARSRLGASYPAIGLRMAMGCATLEGAIEALGRLYASASDAVHIKLGTEQDVAVLSVQLAATDERDAPYLEENFLMWMFMQCMRFLGRPLPVLDVRLRDPEHFSLGSVHWAIGGVARYGEITSIRFPRHLLAEPPASRAGDNIIWEANKLWLEHVAGAHPSTGPTAFVTGGEFIRFGDLVKRSGKSANTLRKQYQAANGRFRDARKRALVDAAKCRLLASDDGVEAIAIELGYSDSRSFRRFLKDATGMTPQQVRDRKHAEDLGEDDRALAEVEALSVRMNI